VKKKYEITLKSKKGCWTLWLLACKLDAISSAQTKKLIATYAVNIK